MNLEQTIVFARNNIGEDKSREIEAKARSDAEKNIFDPPKFSGGVFELIDCGTHYKYSSDITYWDKIQEYFPVLVYSAQYKKRRAKIERSMS